MIKASVLSAVETNTIRQIPLDQRHGRARDLFAIWFGANVMMLTIVTGALAPTIYHLSLLQSVLAIVLGNGVGGIFMALHAAQGPQLGVPQMVQTRGQFGSYGALAVIVFVIVMYVGFTASNLVLGGEALHLLHGGVSARATSLIIGAVSLAAAAYGHDLIHLCSKAVSWIAGAALLLCFGWLLLVHGITPAPMWHGAFTVNGFLGAFSIGALWQIAYAPYVSDYSRYLPPGIGARQAFWASYAGCVLGSIVPMILGALLVVVAGVPDAVAAFGIAPGYVSLFAIPVFSVGMAAGSAMNIYCAVLSGITVVQTFAPAWRGRAPHRIAGSCVVAAVSLLVALFSAGDFMETYTNFILLLLYVLVPWTAINLMDFYLVRKGDYDVAAFFRADGGRYGRYNLPALACYLLGITVQIPFISNPIYTGPIARMLGGADVSWIVGLLVVGPLYWWIMRGTAGRIGEAPRTVA